MVKLKNVVGEGARRPGSSFTARTEDPRPPKRPAFSEGFAVARANPAQPEPSAGYAGPKPYARGSLGQALLLARSSATQCAEALMIDADAASARAPIKSLQSTWARIASQAGYSEPFVLTPNLVFTVVGVLKAANYRSAANYLEAAKRKHIEAGYPWSDQLRQAARMAVRSAKRNIGPSKQAEPLELEAPWQPSGSGRQSTPKAHFVQVGRVPLQLGGCSERWRRATLGWATSKPTGRRKKSHCCCQTQRPTRWH